MITILIVGAGKSSSYLIETVLKHTRKKTNPWSVIVADSDEKALRLKLRNYPEATAEVLDIHNESHRQKLVRRADIVVSLMPPNLHILLAKDCLHFRKHLITSSYASPEMKELDKAVKEAGLMFMCEMGLDPGIDHMSASAIFTSIRKVVSEIISFKSYCGGLIAAESDDNPWHYKFSWNPRNIINAGKEGAHYLMNGEAVHVPYGDMFAPRPLIYCEGVGDLAYYPNRDSLSYIDLYELEQVNDFMRATLRHPDFCKGWDALRQMGFTDTEKVWDRDFASLKDWVAAVTGYNDTTVSLEEFVWKKYQIDDRKLRDMLVWLELFSGREAGNGLRTSGDILLHLLSDKWSMRPEDKDLVVMQHEIEYRHRGELNKLVSTMVVKGENSEHSAMAKTVGLPMAILTELVANKTIKTPAGVLIPTSQQIYRPVLHRLKNYGIDFIETVGY